MRRPPLRLVFVAACSALLLTGCASAVPEIAPPGDVSPVSHQASEQAATADRGTDVVLGAVCANPAGFTVAYPESWAVNAGDVLPACSWFDPRAFTVPEGTDVRTAITFRVRDADDRAIVWPDERARTTVLVDGLTAVRVEQVTTAGLYPVGTPITSYAVDLPSGRVLLAETVGLIGAEHERNVRVLDAMMRSLEVDGATPV